MRRSRSGTRPPATPSAGAASAALSGAITPSCAALVSRAGSSANAKSNYTIDEPTMESSQDSNSFHPQHDAELQVPLASADANAGTSTTKQPYNDDFPAPVRCMRQVCGCQYDLRKENLGYNYSAATKYQALKDSGSLTGEEQPPPLPRIRHRGEHYVDTFNDMPWTCSFGTSEEVSCVFN